MSNAKDETSRFSTYEYKQTYGILYLVVRAVLSGVVSGGINYGIAYAMYSETNLPHAYKLPFTILGDLVVTCLIQGVLIWMITVASIYADIRSGVALPLCVGRGILAKLLGIHKENDLLLSPVDSVSPSRHVRLIGFWVPLQSTTDLTSPGIGKAERYTRFRGSLRRAFWSSMLSIPIYVIPGVILVYTKYGTGYYTPSTAYWIKAIFAGVGGLISSFVIGWVALAGAQVEREIVTLRNEHVVVVRTRETNGEF